MKSKINQKETKNSAWFLKYIGIAVGVVLLSSWSAKASSFVVLQQELQEQTFKEITGVVKTEYGDPIPGVDVKLKGTNIEAETNIEGWYNLKANEGDKIQFVFEGFKTTIVTVGKSNILNVTMVEDDFFDIENYVTEIYRATAISQAKSITHTPSIECGYPSRSFIQILKPFIPTITYTPETTRKPEVILSEVEALTRNGNYTYVVDGVRVSEETFRSLNQNDIESVDIYKHSDITRAMHGNKESQNRVEFKVK